jgi:hypothetical protein
MRRLPSLFILPALVLVVWAAAGCMAAEDRYVGKWRGKVDVDALKSTPMGAMAGNFASMIDPQLDLRPDKTFTLSMSMAPIDGTWKLNKNEITLTPTKVMGMSAADAKKQAQRAMDREKDKMPFPIPFGMPAMPGTEVMHAKIDEKKNTLSIDPGSGTMMAGFGKMVFTKV